jgi:hypothetical protein
MWTSAASASGNWNGETLRVFSGSAFATCFSTGLKDQADEVSVASRMADFVIGGFGREFEI